MNIEVVGVWPFNKGAVLMLEAIKARLSQEFPDARFAVPLSWPTEPRLALGLWGTPARSSRRPGLLSAVELAPATVRRKLGVLSGSDIDVLLDASGFGYGDYWGLAKLEQRLAKRLSIWKKPGKKAVLLPQALGPFESRGMGEAFRSALDRLDLAFVRDDVSQRHVDAIMGPGHERKLRRAPDFTNLLQPPLPSRLSDLKGLSPVIPNEKMVSKGRPGARQNYIRFLVSAITRLAEDGRTPFLLVHEGQADRAIAAEVNLALDRKLRVVEEPSSLDTKAVIAAADVVISSRFHGLVSALSAGVPALACGWSHKYAELMSDYGCPDSIVNVDDPSTWPTVIGNFLARASEPEFRAAIKEKATREKAKSEQMWDETIKVIRSDH